MAMRVSVHFAATIAEHFCGCQARCSDVEISRDIFTGYVWDIACKYLADSSNESAVAAFAGKLYLQDLYLACGCAHNSEEAWKVFDTRYRRFITDLVRFCHRNGTDPEEIADLVLVSLYFHDRSGRQRIASYDGRSSLATWLRVIVINRAINERNERKLALEECVPDIPDVRAVAHFESALRAERYGRIVCDSLAGALRQLTPAERLMLLWRYEDNMALGDMADLLGIHQSNVTRRLCRVQAKVRESVIEILTFQHRLSPPAIQECLDDVVENPMISVSLMSLIKETPQTLAAVPEIRMQKRPNDLHRGAHDR
jgi:RNA polymerase sigma-70 factor, ECF subfamily